MRGTLDHLCFFFRHVTSLHVHKRNPLHRRCSPFSLSRKHPLDYGNRVTDSFSVALLPRKVNVWGRGKIDTKSRVRQSTHLSRMLSSIEAIGMDMCEQ